MDNREKRNILKLVYNTILFFCLICLAYVCYGNVSKMVETHSAHWFNITMIAVTAVILIFIITEFYFTKKNKNKYALAKILYVIFTFVLFGIIVLGFYGYFKGYNIIDHLQKIVWLAIVLIVLLLQLVNFVIGNFLSKLNKSTTVTIDSQSETPNFDDEVILKKRLDELNRKLEIKKLQEKIEKVQKDLDE